MSNIATSIVQSKHLLELGLSKKTSDMSYSEEYFGRDKDGNDEWCWRLNACKFVDVEGIIPAWSLSALLEVMPEKITDGRYNYYLESDLKSEIYYNAIGAMIPNRKGYTKKDNIFEAAFEMVKWLLKIEIIKKSK